MDEQKAQTIQWHLDQIQILFDEIRTHYTAVVDMYDDLDMMAFTFPLSIEFDPRAMEELKTILEHKENTE